ncbi:unnamed protein product [Acanthoscelides obtectus]|uniref:Uncharacterized protein n=1 Tax=Acanthoscelides obtectus TaxID=200917 RepID=A0A9P0JVI0_ACAOB|nr:unnamed protein product [Acanthoscelides obtectus]CAK1668030.1 hypothetical protein AOBTE_LOCUS26186 [Acanthoscelides obtectus]
MSDATEVFPHINVRDLIRSFEQKSLDGNITQRRARSKSFGVIDEYTTVRCDDLETLEDVEEALILTETYMRHYFVYDKDKHFSFLEQLFNILTCTVNIESETKGDREKKKRLNSRTKKLLVVLHSKVPLPTSTSFKTYTNSREGSQYDDVFPSSVSGDRLSPSMTSDKCTLLNGDISDVCVKSLRSNFEDPRNANKKIKVIVSTPKAKSVENLCREDQDTNNNENLHVLEDFIKENEKVSVKKLKANFESNDEIESDNSSAERKNASPVLSRSVSINRISKTLSGNFETTEGTETSGSDGKQSPGLIRSVSLNRSVDFSDETDKSPCSVSVIKLKKIFEDKSRRSSRMEVVNESPKYKVHLDKNMPYTDGNLAFHRLKKAHSGYYLDYLSLIKMANLCKSDGRDDLNQTYHSEKFDADDAGSTRDESCRSDEYNTADELDNLDEDFKYEKATEANVQYKSATIESLNKQETVKTDNDPQGKIPFKEIEIEELDDVDDPKIEDDSSQIEVEVIEDESEEDMEDASSEKGNYSLGLTNL